MSTKPTSPNDESTSVTGNVAEAIALIQRAFALLAITPRVMTSRQRQRGLKFRKGAEPSIRAVRRLSDEHGVVVPGMTTAAMRASLARAEELRKVKTILVGVLRVIETEIYFEEGGAYGNALTLYGMLKKVAHRNAEIRTKLAPVVEFFSYRHPTVVAARAKKRAAAKETAEAESSPDDPVAR
jgi:hypothetical protein